MVNIHHFFLVFNILILFLHTAPTIAQTNTTCPRGTYRTTNGTCTLCLPGTYSNRTNLPACFPCPPGTFIPFRGAQTKNVCRPCPPNTISSQDSSACTPCDQGLVSTNGQQCIRCPPGTYISFSSDFNTQSSQMECQPCIQSEYSTTFNVKICLRCPPGFYSSRMMSTSIKECVNKCPKGFHPSGDKCYPCPKGTYLSDSLPRGTLVSDCIDCPAGFRSDAGSGQCEPCQPGEYGFSASDYTYPDCMKCANGTTTKGTAATMCRIIGGPCPIDHFEDKFGDCRKCTKTQRFNPETRTCISCNENEVSKGKTDQTCVKCIDIIGTDLFFDSICADIYGMDAFLKVDGKCPPGSSISSKHAQVCVKCDRNTYSNTTNAAKCEKCPITSFSMESGSTNCMSCPDGMIFSESSSKCVMQETNCSPGEALFPIRGGPDNCERTNCSIPRPIYGGRGQGRCSDCPLGYGIAKDGSSRCNECKFDEYSVNDSGECRKCKDGKVRSETSGDQCICSGTYAAYRGIVNGRCQKCAVGQAGVFDKVIGKNVCQLCPAGTFYRNEPEESIGSCYPRTCSPYKVCEPCEAGFYTDKEGALDCVRCPNGTTTGGPGESECKLLMIEN